MLALALLFPVGAVAAAVGILWALNRWGDNIGIAWPRKPGP